jgi:diketogulonate reductase-like aldo/keto reductase
MSGIPLSLRIAVSAVFSTSRFTSYWSRNFLWADLLLPRSFWTLTGSPSLMALGEIQQLAAEYACTTSQTIYRLAQLRGVTPLCGTTNEQHMREAVAVESLDFKTDRVDYVTANAAFDKPQ